MTDAIIAVIVLVIIGAAVCYIVKAKKSGAKCIGCPSGGNCQKNGAEAGCCCGCQSDTVKKENR